MNETDLRINYKAFVHICLAKATQKIALISIIIPELAQKATLPHSRPVVEPTATPQCKLFLGGKYSLRHLEKLLELNLKIAVIKGRLL